MSGPAYVSIIIPTTCEAKRRASLLRAIDSVTSDPLEQPNVIVVVNGDRLDPPLLQALQADPRLQVIYEPMGSVARAQRIGRSNVKTAYFGYLDDDDEYLPGAIALRRAHLDAHPQADGVVCNGLRANGTREESYVTDFERIQENPALALARSNWLASCASLLRTSSIGLEFFDERFRYIEWTLLGFKLTLTRRLDFLDVPTYRVNNTPQSASKSDAYALAHVDVLEEILRLPLPTAVRAEVRRKLGSAHHLLSDLERMRGHLRGAWRHHLASLAYPGMLGYLSYTRRLLLVRRPAGES